MKYIKVKLLEFGCVGANVLLSDSDDNEEEFASKVKDNTLPILYEKVKHYVKNGCQNPKSFLEPLTISPQEAYEIEHLTKTQSQCELWKVHRKGLVTSTKLYDVFTRQATIERDSSKSGSSLARKIVDGGDLDHYSKLPVHIEYGRVHEAEARKKYTKLMMTTHENCSIRQSGLVINEAYPI